MSLVIVFVVVVLGVGCGWIVVVERAEMYFVFVCFVLASLACVRRECWNFRSLRGELV